MSTVPSEIGAAPEDHESHRSRLDIPSIEHDLHSSQQRRGIIHAASRQDPLRRRIPAPLPTASAQPPEDPDHGALDLAAAGQKRVGEAQQDRVGEEPLLSGNQPVHAVDRHRRLRLGAPPLQPLPRLQYRFDRPTCRQRDKAENRRPTSSANAADCEGVGGAKEARLTGDFGAEGFLEVDAPIHGAGCGYLLHRRFVFTESSKEEEEEARRYGRC